MELTSELTSEVTELKPDSPLLMALPTAPVAVDPIPEAAEVTSLSMEEPREAICEVRSWDAPRVAAEAMRMAVLTFILADLKK